jgi:antitoxin component YwqK of YwqJK toxin-antitoxin module
MKYILFNNCIISVDDNKIIKQINNLTETKQYKRIGSGTMTFILNQVIPKNVGGFYYDTIEILKKANNLYDYSQDICGVYTGYYITGKLREKYFHNNNIKNSVYTSYFNNGNIEIEYYYINNVLNGFYKKYNYQHNVLLDCFYKNNMLNGPCKIYKYLKYTNYVICKEEHNYIDGKKLEHFS